MDKYIFDKYENNEAPFDGMNVHCSKNLPLNELKSLLEIVVEYLSNNKLIEDEVYKVHDWFQHDGYLPQKTLINSNFIKEFLKSTETLYSINLEDTYVHLGLFDKLARWYLRIYIVDDYDLDENEERNGTFDISMCKDQANDLFDYINSRSNHSLECDKSKSYLATKYAG